MRIMRPGFLFVLLVLLSSKLLMSQTRKTETSQPRTQGQGQREVKSEAPPPTSGTPPTSSDEKAFLRGQLSEMRDYDQHLLATVYWSLSGVFLVVVVVAGLNLFANYRVYERERESLRQEVAAQTRALQTEVEQRFHKLSQSLVATGQKQGDDLHRQLVAEIRKSVGAEIQKYRNEISSLDHRLTKSLFDDTAFRARYCEFRSENYDAFGLWIDNLELMKEIGWMWDSHNIGQVLERLVAILKKGQTISYTFQGRLTNLLDATPPIMSREVEAVRTLLNTVKKV